MNMLRTFLILAIALASATTAQAAVTYPNYFNNGTGLGGDNDGSQHNWAAAIGSLAVTDATLGTPNQVGVSQGVTNTAGVPVVPGVSTIGGFFFALPDAAPQAMLLFTTHTGSIDSYEVTAVPEPATFALPGGLAVLGLAMLRRRR